MNENGLVKAVLTVNVQGMSPNALLPVVIAGAHHGMLATDSAGNGELVSVFMFDSNQPLPDWFQDLKNGAKIQVGLTLQAKFTPAFLVAREPVLPQLGLVPV
jgi:hypothetical protein